MKKNRIKCSFFWAGVHELEPEFILLKLSLEIQENGCKHLSTFKEKG